jgi:hypothetical protein
VRKILLVALAVLVAAALALPASAGPSGQARTAAQAQPSGQLRGRLTVRLGRVHRRWLHPTSGRQPGARFL